MTTRAKAKLASSITFIVLASFTIVTYDRQNMFIIQATGPPGKPSHYFSVKSFKFDGFLPDILIRNEYLKKLKINVWSEQSKHIFLRNFTKFVWIQSNKKIWVYCMQVLCCFTIPLCLTTLCHPFDLIHFLLWHYSTTSHYFAIPLCNQFAMHCATPLCPSILHATFHATLPCHLVK